MNEEASSQKKNSSLGNTNPLNVHTTVKTSLKINKIKSFLLLRKGRNKKMNGMSCFAPETITNVFSEEGPRTKTFGALHSMCSHTINNSNQRMSPSVHNVMTHIIDVDKRFIGSLRVRKLMTCLQVTHDAMASHASLYILQALSTYIFHIFKLKYIHSKQQHHMNSKEKKKMHK